MTKTRELTSVEIDLVSGGRIHVSHIAGFTLLNDDVSGTTTVGAGGYWASHGTLG